MIKSDSITVGLSSTINNNIIITTSNDGLNDLVIGYGSPLTEIARIKHNGGLVPTSVTTSQKLALSPVFGQIVVDSTLHKLCFYNGSAWETISSS